jgi:type IX secretion system PorP/SprF family membrane protein
LKSQQDPHFTQYFDNYLFLNPAYAGNSGGFNLSAIHREQWVGFEGRPRTSIISMHSPLNNEAFGLGLSVARDVLGPVGRTYVFGDVSYGLTFKNKSKLTLGIKPGMSFITTRISELQTAQNNDPSFQNNYLNRINPNIGLGIFYQSSSFFAGFSTPRILELSMDGSSNNKEIRHYYTTIGGNIKLSENWDLRPTSMLKFSVNTPISIDFSVAAAYKKFFHLGAMYRFQSALGIFGQFIVNKQFKIGLASDFSTSVIRNNSAGTYEILLSYDIISNKDDQPKSNYVDQLKVISDKDGDLIPDKDDLCPEIAGSIKFKGCPDTDGDGLSDIEDQCPNNSGPKEKRGCPLFEATNDRDNDGIIDSLDKCPDLVGAKENNGCPLPDSDGDGILDKDDQCPNIAGTIENNGCPEKDTDGDGLKDKSDACPMTPGPIENNGCPKIEKDIEDVLNSAFNNLEFESGKDKIKTSSIPALDKLAAVLTKNSNFNLDISGHTDNVGDDNGNMLLSKKRSEAVKAYLISKGIEASRLNVFYFGETKPISDNTTPEGRKKNRRVEMKIVFN